MLHFLEKLNLSYNNIYGKIPYMTQLTTSKFPIICLFALTILMSVQFLWLPGNRPRLDSQVDDQEDAANSDTIVWSAIALM